MPLLTVLRWSNAKQQWLIFSHVDFDTQAVLFAPRLQ